MRYLTSPQKQLSAEHVEARNIVNITRAAHEMRLVAGLSNRIKKPVYHLVLAWHPEEIPSLVQQKEAARALIDAIGLSEHQSVTVTHTEEKGGIAPGATGRHHETHIAINRVKFDGTVAALRNDYSIVERAVADIALKMGFRVVDGRFNREGGLTQPGIGDKIGSIKADSGRETLADEIRADPFRIGSLRSARRQCWHALIEEFRRQGIGLMLGPPPRRHDLQRGIVMFDLAEPARRIKISALDRSDEKWGAAALAAELGPIPDFGGFPEHNDESDGQPKHNVGGGNKLRPANPLFEKFVRAREMAIERRKTVSLAHAREREDLIVHQRKERARIYDNARRRRRILRDIFGRRSVMRVVLNWYFDHRAEERLRQIKINHDVSWAELRQRQATERITIPRWSVWRRRNHAIQPTTSMNSTQRQRIAGLRHGQDPDATPTVHQNANGRDDARGR